MSSSSSSCLGGALEPLPVGFGESNERSAACFLDDAALRGGVFAPAGGSFRRDDDRVGAAVFFRRPVLFSPFGDDTLAFLAGVVSWSTSSSSSFFLFFHSALTLANFSLLVSRLRFCPDEESAFRFGGIISESQLFPNRKMYVPVKPEQSFF